MSTPVPAPPPPPTVAGPQWRGWPEVRADLRSSAWLVGALALAGLPAGVLWWLLAPRADYRITGDGPVALGNPVEELFVADDAVFALVLAGVGAACGGAAWWLRRRRGVATLVALAIGSLLTGVVAWQTGELLGAGPSEAELAEVGGVVTTSLTLGSPPALAIGAFTAVLAYVVAVLYVADDGLGRVGSVLETAPSQTAPSQTSPSQTSPSQTPPSQTPPSQTPPSLSSPSSGS